MPKSTSVWAETAPLKHYPALTADLTVDACVIGAGIAGVTTAYLLAHEGLRVALLDDGPPGAGQTGVTTAHLAYVIDDRFTEMVRLHGVEGAQLACDSHRSAIARIESLCSRERIDAEFARVSGYLFLGPEHDKAYLEQEMDAARQAGADVELLGRAPVAGFESGVCLHFPRQGQFHPLKYINGLVDAFVRSGGQVFGGTRATKATGGSQAAVETAGGATVSARAIVVATNVPFNDLVAIHTKQAPYHTYVVGARMPPGALTPALYWDTSDPYHYIRVQRMNNADLG